MQEVGTQYAKDSRSIPSLDGLRAISIALVILAHAQSTRGFPLWIPSSVADHGTLGVHIFFVISGFLITRLLWKNRQQGGRFRSDCFTPVGPCGFSRRSIFFLLSWA